MLGEKEREKTGSDGREDDEGEVGDLGRKVGESGAKGREMGNMKESEDVWVAVVEREIAARFIIFLL